MPISKLKTFIIIVRSIVSVFIYSLQTTIVAYFAASQNKRLKIDKIIKRWSTSILEIVQLSYAVHGRENLVGLSNKPCIVMSNHASLYDIPLILAALPLSIRMIAKKELFKVPVWGRALRAAEFISMNRKDRTEAIQALQLARQKMQTGIVPWISPEGTRSRTGEIQTFKKGGFLVAIKTGALIVPVKISGAYAVLPPKSLDFHIGKKVDLYISAPIDASEYSIQDINKLMILVKNKLT